MSYLELITYFNQYRKNIITKLELSFAIALWQESIQDFSIDKINV